jgi:transposase
MNARWLSDARKIPDEVMNYLRRLAVRAVEEQGHSPELIAAIFGISRSRLYEWLRRYRAHGEAALDTRTAPGAARVITRGMDGWLRKTVLQSTPVDHGYDTVLWTRKILVELLERRFGVRVAESTVGLHLRALDLSPQQPGYRARERNRAQVAAFLAVKFPRIQRLAERMGADIAFEDEAGVGVRTRAGRTWGARGQTPTVDVADRRGGYNVLSIVTARGELQSKVVEKSVDGNPFIAFLEDLLRDRPRPLILLVDRASFHRSAAVRQFVRTHRTQLRLFFFPAHAPELNPDEQVWNEIKHRQIGRQPVKNKLDLRRRLDAALRALQAFPERVRSFFHLPDTQYAAIPESALTPCPVIN